MGLVAFVKDLPACSTFSYLAPASGGYFRADRYLTSQTPRQHLPSIEPYAWTPAWVDW